MKDVTTAGQDALMLDMGFSDVKRKWTVVDLLDLLPESVVVDGDEYYFVLRKYYHDESSMMLYEAAYEDLCRCALTGAYCNSECALDALFALVVSLFIKNILPHEKA